MLEFARFVDALRSDDGLEREGVLLPPETLAALRGHEAYALAWFQNWTRDGQPSDGRGAVAAPYPTSPEPEVSAFTVAGYARTGDDPVTPEPPAPATRRAAGTSWAARSGDRAPAVEPLVGSAPLVPPEAPAPGWYPSPENAAHEQWWNGSSWTPEHRATSKRRRGFALFARR